MRLSAYVSEPFCEFYRYSGRDPESSGIAPAKVPALAAKMALPIAGKIYSGFPKDQEHLTIRIYT